MSGSDQPFPAADPTAIPWLSVEQTREVDRIMVDDLGISLVRMMELDSLVRRTSRWHSRPQLTGSGRSRPKQLAIVRRIGIPTHEVGL